MSSSFLLSLLVLTVLVGLPWLGEAWDLDWPHGSHLGARVTCRTERRTTSLSPSPASWLFETLKFRLRTWVIPLGA